jgi:hypothetical protein
MSPFRVSIRHYPAWLLLVAATTAGAGCDRTDDVTPGPITTAASCDTLAAPVYLKSKLDDDDGDGNPYDEDYPSIDDEDDDIADHAWIRDGNGLYHLFFHTEDKGAGSYIEHYTSRDLCGLDYDGPALRADPAGWDSYGLWAPHVIETAGVYYMFYTGATGPGSNPLAVQRIGVAVSNDLYNWTRLPVNRCPGTSGDGCIYECRESWTTAGDSLGSSNQQCRDAFVMWDPDGRRWLMFATAKSTNQFAVVTVAASPDLVEWTGLGFVDATRRLVDGVGAQTTGGQAENPFVVTHDGTYFLLFTDWQDPEDWFTAPDPRTIVQYATSPTLAADPSGSANWTYRGYTPDPGVNAIEVQRIGRDHWIMSQSASNPRSGSHPAHRRHLRLKCIVWEGEHGFHTENAVFPCMAAARSSGPLDVP